MTCHQCGAVLPAGGRFCPACGSPATDHESGTGIEDLPTRLATDETPAAERSSSAGWLSSSGAINHGRFEPGAVIDGRYRIIGLLGRGGMGEVFRADDLRLGQPVALKFLPVGLSQDPVRLAQLHNEVRMAREVSHPAVCRVHDVGEYLGAPFLSMEYVDGENLATSLRRVGRFPEERAIELARQIAAGLAAAHRRGVLHRDLKPANIMIDGDGLVRLMDFGLAAVGQVADIRAGTPAYMAPEQLQGREVTPKSDIYALGLVLYELFTGRRAFEAATVAELVSRQESGDITRPGEIVRTLDSTVERAILRCLERDPARRPPSAIAVAASLPGGDPLAAALAAGETPSPEVVAAAGGDAASLRPMAGVSLVVVLLAGLLASAALAGRFQLISQIAAPLHPRTLADRARQLGQALGAPAGPRDRADGMFADLDIQTWLWSLPAPDRQRALAVGWPSPILFWQRTSPRLLVPADPGLRVISRTDPPMTLSGMSIVALGMDGRLMEFLRAPSEHEAAPAMPAPPVDWQPFFDAAGLDRARFTESTPAWTPPYFADARVAWDARDPASPGMPLRLEASSYRGTPVSFQLVGPWSRPSREVAAATNDSRQIIAIAGSVVVTPALLTVGLVLARRNQRLGRGDTRGAIVLATTLFTLSLAGWVLGGSHFASLLEEQARFGAALATALYTAALFGLVYLAIEPTVRRVWPQILITWSRLVNGRIRDPLVGRDLVVGCLAGMIQTLVTFAHYLLPGWLGLPAFRPAPVALPMLLGVGPLLGGVSDQVAKGLTNAVLGGLGLVIVRMVVRRPLPTVVVATLVFAPLAAQNQIETGTLWLDLTIGALLVGVIFGVVLRYGLFAAAIAFFAHFLTKDAPLTLDADAYFVGTSTFAIALVTGLAVLGFVWARAEQPVFGRVSLD
jgi:eukaryotic-like serine/threonine-protein kinase